MRAATSKMMTKRHNHEGGSTLVVAVLVVAVLTMVISAYYQSLVPKFRGTYQASSWQEALHGAEAGVDHTIRLLNGWTTSTADPDAYPWTSNGWTTTNATYALN